MSERCFYELGKEDKPDVYLAPEVLVRVTTRFVKNWSNLIWSLWFKDSVILQVKAAEIVASDSYAMKCTLR